MPRIRLLPFIALTYVQSAAGQQMYQAHANWLNSQGVTGKEAFATSCPGGTNTRSLDTGFAMTSVLRNNLAGPLSLSVDDNGNWMPVNRTFITAASLSHAPNSPVWAAVVAFAQRSTSEVSLSGSGIVTVQESGGGIDYVLNSMYPQFSGVVEWLGNETIDLNSGTDIWHFTAKISGKYLSTPARKSCTLDASFVGDYSGHINVTFTPPRPSACAGGENPLRITFQKAQMTNWCWAAVGQMAMQYLRPSQEFYQCEQAEKEFNLPPNTCCTAGSGPELKNTSQCNKTGYPLFEAYKFTAPKTDSAISFADLKNEIDCGRPVVAFWTYRSFWEPKQPGEDSHDVLAIGYNPARNGREEVLVADPALGFYWVPYSGRGLVFNNFIGESVFQKRSDYYPIRDTERR